MQVGDSLNYLGCNFPNRFLGDCLVAFFKLVQEVLEIPTLTVFHKNVDFLVLSVDDFVIILHNIDVIQLFQNVYFS